MTNTTTTAAIQRAWDKAQQAWVEFETYMRLADAVAAVHAPTTLEQEIRDQQVAALKAMGREMGDTYHDLVDGIDPAEFAKINR